MDPFSFPKGTKEMACQVLIAQAALKKALERGVIPKRLRTKKYLNEAVLLYAIEVRARKEKIPRLFYNAVPSDLLPWRQKEFRSRRKFRHKEQNS
jgi:hypothetical protein